MIRILQIKGGMNRAGSGIMIMNLYRAIDKTRFQFDFLYFDDKEHDFDEEILNLGGEIFRIESKNPITRARKLKKILQNNPQIKVVHAHIFYANAFYLYAAYKAGITKRISHSHRTMDDSRNKLITWLYRSFSLKVQKKYSTHFLACNEAAGKFLFPNCKNVQIIHNAMDIEQLLKESIMKKNYFKSRFSLPDKTLIITQIGRLVNEKNHFLSIKIAEELKKRKLDFKMYFIGEGLLEVNLKNKVSEYDLCDYVYFMGLRNDVPRLLGSSDVTLLPSFHEGFPLVLIESQTVGVPALVSDGVPRDVDLGMDLVYFEKLENLASDWVDKLLMVVNNKKRFSDEKRIKVLKEKGFDVHQNIHYIEELYSKS